MKHHEAEEQSVRLQKYRALEKMRNETYSAIKSLAEPWENGPCGQGPFTGNTRESRKVESLHIKFTPTRGGSAAVSTDIFNLDIEAWELGKALEAMLKAKLETINAAIEKL